MRRLRPTPLSDRRSNRPVAPVLLTVAALVAGAVAVVAAASPATAATATARQAYTPLSAPSRVSSGTSVGGRKLVTVSLGSHGVPSGATAVVLQVAAGAGKAAGYLTAYQKGGSRPGAASISFAAGQTIDNLVVAKVNSDRKVSVYNGSTKAVKLYLDVAGYFSPATAGQGSFGAITPTRVLSTTSGIGAPKAAVRPNRALTVQATGGSTGIPATASAVLMNITVAKPTRAGALTAYVGTRPAIATMNFAAGASTSHLSVVPVNSSGRAAIFNGSTGTVQLYGDVVGWFAGGDPTATGSLGVLTPKRVLSSTVAAHHTAVVSPLGRGGVPHSHVAAVAMTVRVDTPPAKGHLAVNPGSPATFDLNFGKGQTIANLTMAKVASNGTVRVYNGSSKAVKVLADVDGYVLSSPITTPTVSTSHYVRTEGTNSQDTATLSAAGTADARAGSRFVVLDFGAQTTTMTTGVELSATTTRITYSQLVGLVQAYVGAYAQQAPNTSVTVAVATNSDGDFKRYPSEDRAEAWATQVIEPLRSSAPSTVTIAAADDIEADFAATEAQARSWETEYLTATQAASDSSSLLYFIGSADGCPSTYGAMGGKCNYDWTEAQLFTLAGGSDPRIHALPQIYNSAQAVQWSNIAATGKRATMFDGALTEHATCPTSSTGGCGGLVSFAPAFGFAALFHTLSTVVSAPAITQVTDLDILN